VDVTVAEAREQGLPMLHTTLSSKWSLRTDRAQDCVSQGVKLVHSVMTNAPLHCGDTRIPPRDAQNPRGRIDCVYHLDLLALTAAWEELAAHRKQPRSWSP
jgi:hypothetical protein